MSAFLFRFIGADSRCENRIEQAKLVLEDYENNVFSDNALAGLSSEYRGDFEMILGSSEAAREAYQAARQVYHDVHPSWMAEPIFEWNLSVFQEIASNTQASPTSDFYLDCYEHLPERINLKTNHFQKYLTEALTRSEFEIPV